MTLRGVQTPRISLIPEYESSAGREAIELAAAAGLVLDPWQEYCLIHGLGERRDGRWAAFECGIVVSRQNGKGGIFEARCLAGLFLFGEKLILYSAHEFKALDVDTPILTSAGWSTMGELVDGDEVFAPDGTLTKVVAAHPVRHGRPCYRLRFDDGQEVVADAEHLWAVEEVEGARRVARVLTTQQLVERGVSTVVKRSGRDRRTYRFRVALPAPLTGEDADLPIDPWLLGAWLGDGDSAGGRLTVGVEDLPYTLGRLDALGETYSVREDPRTDGRVLSVCVYGLRARLRAAGVLGAKRIPEAYMLASERQRRDLLAGVMDTDGTVSAHQVAVTMSKRELMEDVASLVRSLGYKATLREFRASVDGRDAGPMWRVQFSASQDVSPFQMPRKSEKIRPRQGRVTRSQYNAIVAIEPVASRPTRCITVAHESSQFLVGRGFVPTHNTATEMFLRMKALVDNTDALRKRVKRIRTSHGDEGIELLDGRRLRFVARSTGSGRGFSGDVNIMDEAFNLAETSVDALMPTMSARENPQLWYGSSAADKAIAPCEQLARVRRRAIKGDDPSLFYAEWSIDPHTDQCARDADGTITCTEHDNADDPEAWAKANPALGIRISVEHVARERASMGAKGFARERLGVGNWPMDQEAQWEVIPEARWRAVADEASDAAGKVAFAIHVAPDRSWAAIAVAGRRADGLLHVEVVDYRLGTQWVPDRARQLQERWDPCAWVVDAGSPAGSLIADLELVEFKRLDGTLAHLEITKPTSTEVGHAYGQFVDAVMPEEGEPTVRVMPHPALDAAVAGAAVRPIGRDAKAWDAKVASVDICPLVAATFALWGFATKGHIEEEAVEAWGAWV
jgi:hypothetical protein